jgi:single-strand DNA-binding protein
VLVEGRLRPDSNGNPTVFQRKDGTWGASYEITADTVRFLTPKGEESNQNFGPMDDDEDIPF